MCGRVQVTFKVVLSGQVEVHIQHGLVWQGLSPHLTLLCLAGFNLSPHLTLFCLAGFDLSPHLTLFCLAGFKSTFRMVLSGRV